jgi:hypothetical protein
LDDLGKTKRMDTAIVHCHGYSHDMFHMIRT